MSIVHLSYDSSGGAGRAAKRAHLACRAVGLASEFAYLKSEGGLTSDLLLGNPDIGGDQDKTGLGKTLVDDIQWGFLRERRTRVSNTLLSIPYPGIDFSKHHLLAKADIIHLHWPTWTVTPRGLERWLLEGRTVFWTLHDFWGMTGGCHYPTGCEQYLTLCMKCPQLVNDLSFVSNSFAEKLRCYGTGGSLSIVTPSQWLANSARKSAVFRNRDIFTIANSIDLDVFHQTREREELRENFGVARGDCVLFLGSYDLNERRKGVALIMQAIRELATSGELVDGLPQGALIYLALTGRTAQLEDIPGVRMLNFGLVTDDDVMCDVLSITDLVCVPSLEDNYPNVIVEAMACGTPCLGYATGGIPEMIEDGVTGLVVDPVGTVAALKRGLLRFTTSHFMDLEMRDACRRTAMNRNRMEVVGSQLRERYEAALARPVKLHQPLLQRRAQRAFRNLPISQDLVPGRDFLQFPANLAVLGFSSKSALDSFEILDQRSERSSVVRLISIRTQHEHHSGYSGPYQFLRYLPEGIYDSSNYSVPLSNEFAGSLQDLYQSAGMLMGTAGFAHRQSYWLAESEVLMQCVAEQVDIVHYIDGEHGGWLLPRIPSGVYKNSRRPCYIATFHQPPQVLKTLVNFASVARLDGVIALCESQREFLADYVSHDRLFVVPHGVDTRFFHPQSKSYTRPSDGKIRLLLIGHWLRDLKLAFAAFDNVAAAGLDVEFKIIAPGFPIRPVDPRIIVQSGVSDEMLREAYWNADVVMIPLLDATANNAILEGMACGRPVVSTDVGGVLEAVGCEAGILVSGGDRVAFADAVLQLALNPGLRESMGMAARARAELFSWEAIARAHDAVYKQVLLSRLRGLLN